MFVHGWVESFSRLILALDGNSFANAFLVLKDRDLSGRNWNGTKFFRFEYTNAKVPLRKIVLKIKMFLQGSVSITKYPTVKHTIANSPTGKMR